MLTYDLLEATQYQNQPDKIALFLLKQTVSQFLQQDIDGFAFHMEDGN